MDLLAAEITARTGKDPGEHYRALTAEFGTPVLHAHRRAGHARAEGAAEKLSPEAVTESTLAGEPITAKLTSAPGNDAPIGGLKVMTASGWFAARPRAPRTSTRSTRRASRDEAHLDAILAEAQAIVNKALIRRTARSMTATVSRRIPRRPACCCTSPRCHRRTASATWARGVRVGRPPCPMRASRWWQALPLGPTGYGDSPYQSLSSFAGNPPHQPRRPDRGRPPPAGDWRAGFPTARSIIDAVIPFKHRLLERRGPTSGRGAAGTCGPPSSSSATIRPTGWTTTPCSAP